MLKSGSAIRCSKHSVTIPTSVLKGCIGLLLTFKRGTIRLSTYYPVLKDDITCCQGAKLICRCKIDTIIHDVCYKAHYTLVDIHTRRFAPCTRM